MNEGSKASVRQAMPRPTKKRGPKNTRAHPLSPVSAKAVIVTLRQVQSDERLSSLELRNRIIEFGDNLKEFPLGPLYEGYDHNIFSPVKVRTDVLEKALERGHLRDDELMKAFYLYIREKYDNIYNRKVAEEDLISKEPFIYAARALFDPTDILDYGRIESYSGRYKLYRPLHLNPMEDVAVCLLEIGSDGNIFDCRFVTGFEAHGKSRRHISQGKLIIHGSDQRRLSAITTSTKTGPSHFVFHFDYLSVDDDGIDEMGGVMIASYGNDPSSAWPIFAIKSAPDEKWEPHTISRSALGALACLIHEPAAHWCFGFGGSVAA